MCSQITLNELRHSLFFAFRIKEVLLLEENNCLFYLIIKPIGNASPLDDCHALLCALIIKEKLSRFFCSHDCCCCIGTMELVTILEEGLSRRQTAVDVPHNTSLLYPLNTAKCTYVHFSIFASDMSTIRVVEDLRRKRSAFVVKNLTKSRLYR